MNRLKFWLFALIVMGAAGFGMRWLALDLRKKAIDGIDRQLLAAQAQAEAAERSLSAELAAVASLAGADEQLGLTLLRQPEAPGAKRKPGQPLPPTVEQLDEAVTQAASEAVSKSVQLLGAAQGKREVFATSLEGFQRREAGDEDVTAFLQDALDRKVRRGYALLKGQLHVGAGVPLGNDAGALALFTPVDGAWAKAASAGSGATLFLVAQGQTIASGRDSEAGALAKLARTGVAPADAGSLGLIDVSVAKVQLPKVGSFLGPLPADRVVARPLAGVKDGRMVLAISARSVLEPIVRLEWYVAAALALTLLLTIIFGFLIRPTEVASPVPPALLEVARKIAKGDFSARAPVLAGKVGTVAEALNKAAEAAQAGDGAGEPVRGTLTSEFFAKGSEPEPPAEPAADPFVLPTRAPRAGPVAEAEPAPAAPEPLPSAPEPTGETRAVSDTARLDGANLTGAAFEAAPVAAPRPAPAPAPAPVAAPSELLSGAARAAPAGEGGDEEQHWREVFRDFVRTRGECGESAEGLTYERFRQKLEANKGALVAKYGCRTVRFQVYVKDGKAALKATPVR